MLFVTKHPLPPTPLFLYVPYGVGKRYRERIRGVVLSGLNIFTDAFLLSEISSNRDMNNELASSLSTCFPFSPLSRVIALYLSFSLTLSVSFSFSVSLSQSISHLLPAQPEAKRWEGIVAYFSSLPWNTFISSGMFQPLSRFLTYVSIAICAWQWWLWHETDGMMGPSVHGTGAATLSWTETTHKHTHTHPGEYNFPFYMLLYFVILFSKWLLSTNWISLHKHFANCS